MPLAHINSILSCQPLNKKAGSIHKIPANWRVAKGLAPNINTIKSTSTYLLSLDMGEPILTMPDLINVLRDTIKKRLHKHHDESAARGIAVYGFSAQLLNSCRFVRSTRSKKTITTIANLNTELDLTKVIFNYSSIPKSYIHQSLHQQLNNFINALSESKPKHHSNFGNKNPESYLYLWKEYLHKSRHKIDLFKYIHSKEISIEEKNNVIKKLIIKNTPSSVDSQELYDFIIENNIINCTSLTDFKKKITELKNNKNVDLDKYIIGLFELVQNHFFRNTSKLGLDFFNENAFSIVMTWNDAKNAPLSLEDIRQKTFKQGHRRLLDGQSHIEPITFSEIRHLDKHPEQFAHKIIRIITDDKHVAFSLGLEGHWGIYDKAEFLPEAN
ncbi:TPA: hypothetical protein ACS7XC_000806 [Providencia alcalifaciens]